GAAAAAGRRGWPAGAGRRSGFRRLSFLSRTTVPSALTERRALGVLFAEPLRRRLLLCSGSLGLAIDAISTQHPPAKRGHAGRGHDESSSHHQVRLPPLPNEIDHDLIIGLRDRLT